MEPSFKTLGTKLALFEADLVSTYCKRKGTTPSKFIRELLLREIQISVPNNVAGKNTIKYNKQNDTFSWRVELDTGEKSEVIETMSPAYLESLSETIKEALKQRDFAINKKQKNSTAVPSQLLNKKRGAKNA